VRAELPFVLWSHPREKAVLAPTGRASCGDVEPGKGRIRFLIISQAAGNEMRAPHSFSFCDSVTVTSEASGMSFFLSRQ